MMGWAKTRTSKARRDAAARAAQHVLIVGTLLVIQPMPVHAKSMALNSCLSLWRQTSAAKSNGLGTVMAQGAEGARTRLSKAQLAQIKTHIDLVERLKFRCRRFVSPPPGADAP